MNKTTLIIVLLFSSVIAFSQAKKRGNKAAKKEKSKKEYCEVWGGWKKGSYNADTIVTMGGKTNINHASVVDTDENSNKYTLVKRQKLTLAKGDTFNISVAQKGARSVIWVDWNNNQAFEKGERLLPLGPSAVWIEDIGWYPSGTLIVPPEANAGTTRMRIVTGDPWSYADYDDPAKYIVKIPDTPCDKMTSASIKDFEVEITE